MTSRSVRLISQIFAILILIALLIILNLALYPYYAWMITISILFCLGSGFVLFMMLKQITSPIQDQTSQWKTEEDDW